MFVIEAVGLGLALVFMVGPVFFALTQVSLNRGITAGVFMATGIVLADLILVFACLQGLSAILTQNIETVKYAGGLIFLTFGTINMVKRTEVVDIEDTTQPQGKWRYLFKGFLINITNPFVILFWLGTAGLISSRYPALYEAQIFFIIMLGTTFAGDVSKVLLSNKLRRVITPKVLLWGNRCIGLILILAGLRFLLTNLELHS